MACSSHKKGERQGLAASALRSYYLVPYYRLSFCAHCSEINCAGSSGRVGRPASSRTRCGGQEAPCHCVSSCTGSDGVREEPLLFHFTLGDSDPVLPRREHGARGPAS